MSKYSHATVDHEKIRKWAEERGARPASVIGTRGDDEVGVLRLDFDQPEDSLREISWDEFFQKFEEKHLAFLYQDRMASGDESRFFKFVDRDHAQIDDRVSKTKKIGKGASKEDRLALKYLNKMLSEHGKLVKLYEKALEDIKEERLVEALKMHLSQHESHLSEIESLVLGLGGEPKGIPGLESKSKAGESRTQH